MTEIVRPRPLTAIGLLLVGAAVTAYVAHPPGTEMDLSVQGPLTMLGAAVIQLGFAAALWLRLPGGWALAVVAFVGHWLAIAFLGLLLLVFTALPFEGGGPLTGNAFNPIRLTGLVTFGVGAGLLYGVAVRDLMTSR